MKTLMDEIKSCLVIYYLKGYKYVLVVSFWKIHHIWSRDINLVSSFLCSPSSSQSLSYTLLGNPRKTHFFFCCLCGQLVFYSWVVYFLGVLFVLAELDLGGALHSRHRAQLLLALSLLWFKQILKCHMLLKILFKVRLGQIASGPARYFCLSLFPSWTHVKTHFSWTYLLFLYLYVNVHPY